MSNEITVTIQKGGVDYLDFDSISFKELRERLTKWEQEIPEQYRDLLRLEIDVEYSYGDPYAAVAVHYTRPMTEEEVAYREQHLQIGRQMVEAEERKQLERLLAKYSQGAK